MPIELPVAPTAADWTRGPADAPVTLVEYGDFQCGDCREAYLILKPILEEMGDGLRFVYRQLPLTDIHPFALDAAKASEAAGELGQFWSAHDALYEDGEWLTSGDVLAPVVQAGMDAPELQTRFADPATYANVRADVDGIRRAGVGHTPTLFINGVQYEGVVSAADLRRALSPST